MASMLPGSPIRRACEVPQKGHMERHKGACCRRRGVAGREEGQA